MCHQSEAQGGHTATVPSRLTFREGGKACSERNLAVWHRCGRMTGDDGIEIKGRHPPCPLQGDRGVAVEDADEEGSQLLVHAKLLSYHLAERRASPLIINE
eukprot:CAMPEP_0206138538 /NCGR_PEP_ID=MMETSP1473-20131121/3392_1 /ASSEMBLY_ACC=CAM_ASM_001109 /TAXON_ID=1461547 /ORGANISM="Stichococcus sp, Strain RCC1054" /LENGTH=100 /DNA_ID=CAMNT_0053531999 /DNA_START=357 /DNA_END=659 /DNA_ORIENTATION=-